MIRALTIRFGIMCIGVAALVALVNILNAPPALAMGSLMAYLLAGSLIIGNYIHAHEDEIPPRRPHDESRR
jgi:hypothetical protein